MTKFQKILGIIATVLLCGVVLIFMLQGTDETAHETTVMQAGDAIKTPLVRFPIPELATTTATPLPSLEQSDDVVKKEFNDLFDLKKFGSLFILNDIVNRIVVTVDNLQRRTLPWNHMSLNPMPGVFLAKESDAAGITIDPKNYGRYRLFVEFIESVNAESLADVYVRFYPLFQESYRSLGYTNLYFNDLVISSIDHVLETPDIQGDVLLKQPSVHYVFADPALEGLSSSQKVMIRIGSSNAARIKTKLIAFRQALVTRTNAKETDN